MTQQAQEIILYRSPVEKAMWDSLYGGDTPMLAPIITGVIAFFVVFLALNYVLSSMTRSPQSQSAASYISLAVGAVCGFGVVWKMML